MRKRIYMGMLVINVCSVLLLVGALSVLAYAMLKAQALGELRERADMVRQWLDAGGALHGLRLDGDTWYTVTAPEGDVVLNIEGVAEASERVTVSEPLAGGGVIYLSRTIHSMLELFARTLPIAMAVAAAVAVLGAFLSRRVTQGILTPLASADLSGDDIFIYDELSDLTQAISASRRSVKAHAAYNEKQAGLMRSIIGSVREGLVLLDKDSVIVSANQSAMEIFGKQSVHVTGKSLAELTRNAEVLENARLAAEQETREMILVKAGKSWQVFFSPAAEGVIILFLDITERRQAEKLRQEFSANVSHELKTPLANISGYAEIMQSGMPKDIAEYIRFASKIDVEAKRLSALVNDILLLSRLEERAQTFDSGPIDVTDMAHDVLSAAKNMAAQNGVALGLEAPGESLIVQGSINLMYDLIFNLVENGIKYNVPGGAVTVELSRQGSTLLIAVRDTGIGIAPEHMGRIFERFYRVDRSRSKKTGGTGLGLSIVKHIAQTHNGSVDVKSQVDEGTEFLVRLPLCDALV